MTKPVEQLADASTNLDNIVARAVYQGTRVPDTIEEAMDWMGCLCKDVCYLAVRLREERQNYDHMMDTFSKRLKDTIDRISRMQAENKSV